MWQTPDVGQPDQQIAAAYEAAVAAEPATGAYSNRRGRETRASLHQMFAERKSREGDFTNACTCIMESGQVPVGADESQGARLETAPTRARTVCQRALKSARLETAPTGQNVVKFLSVLIKTCVSRVGHLLSAGEPASPR